MMMTIKNAVDPWHEHNSFPKFQTVKIIYSLLSTLYCLNWILNSTPTLEQIVYILLSLWIHWLISFLFQHSSQYLFQNHVIRKNRKEKNFATPLLFSKDTGGRMHAKRVGKSVCDRMRRKKEDRRNPRRSRDLMTLSFRTSFNFPPTKKGVKSFPDFIIMRCNMMMNRQKKKRVHTYSTLTFIRIRTP